MSKPCIICVAITGSVPTKADNPAVPITVSEQIESTQEAFEAGASIAHCHVRLDDGTPCSDPDRFAQLKEGLQKHCPGMIIQFSTGGRSGAGNERGGMLPLRPDMASLSVGSNNFPTRVYENPPELISWLASEMRTYQVVPEVEAFDMSHILHAIRMHQEGLLYGKLYVQFVMGVRNAMPADKDVFDFYVKTMKARAPDAEWCAAGIGPNQVAVNEWAIAAGGHTRTGLEDNIRWDKGALARSNAVLVKRAVDICQKYGVRLRLTIRRGKYWGSWHCHKVCKLRARLIPRSGRLKKAYNLCLPTLRYKGVVIGEFEFFAQNHVAAL